MEVYVSAATTCFVVQCNRTVFEVLVGLGVLAVLAENEL